uniref:thiopurine S-methyltransferase n=1 Tax=Arion vulgaris TaxID=1028688 RepID=A0A0B7AQW2_9EUPU
MSSQSPQTRRMIYWKNRWAAGKTEFHKTNVHQMLNKHLDKLIPEGKANKIFFPLCGKAVDMKWLADKGFTVVGVDGVSSALQDFYTEQGLESTVEDVTKAGKNIKVYKSPDDEIKLYCCDIMDFTREFEGTVDAVWDRGSLVALNREDVAEYVQVIKNILSPQGRILLEVVEYDVSIMADVEGPTKPPPPYPMYEEEVKKLYEPECTVQFVERNPFQFAGKGIHAINYLIIRKF